MRYIICLFLFYGFLLSAAPVQNPYFPQLIEEGFLFSCDSWINFRLGYETNSTIDAKMKQTEESSGRVDRFTLRSGMASLTCNIQNRIDLYGLVGATRMGSTWNISPALGSLIQVEEDSHSALSWAAGGRVILFIWGKTVLGLGGRYDDVNSSLLWITKNGSPYFVGDSSSISYQAWQVDMSLATKMDIFVPYIGVKYSDISSVIERVANIAISNNSSSSLHMKNRNNVGLVLGCSISTAKLFMLNLEARLIDEEAVTVSGEIRF